jgi:hypothetical protein
MKRLPAILFCVALLALARPALAGPPGFAFLEVPPGARAAGMGGAFTSLAQGSDAAFWNPAGLGGAKRVEVGASHAEYVQSLRLEQFAIAGGALGGGLAGSVRALYSEPIAERDEIGNLVGTFGSHDLEFALSYGRALTSSLSVGASAQAYRERIADASASTWGLGVGAQWAPARAAGLRLGLVAQNLGPSARFDIDGTSGAAVGLPAAVQGGAALERSLAGAGTVRAALEGRFTRGRPGVGMAGVELAMAGGARGAAAVRAGLRVNDDASTFSMGAGYTVSAIRVDYAFVPLRLDLGETHRVSFTASF